VGKLDGKVALITGASQGMGAAHARVLAKEGARVILTDVQEAEGKALADEIGESALFIRHDVASWDNWQRVLAEGEARFGPVTVLVNNAGIIGPIAPTTEIEMAAYDRVIQINQHGVMYGMRSVLPGMVAAGGGAIVNISSIAGMIACFGFPNLAYVASKFAVRGMTKAVAAEYGKHGVRVNSASDRPFHRRRQLRQRRAAGRGVQPSAGEVQATVRLGTAADLQKAVDAANAALPGWAATNPQRRARVMFNFKALVEKNMDELAGILASEHGKVIADAKGDIQRGLEVIEFACGIPHALKGEYTQGAGPGIDVYSMRQPLGICVGITPFNFPAMIPMWMFGVAIACGNAFILKPSERDPTVPVRLAELMKEAGLPDGILNVVHGDKEMVDAILDHPDVKAISFVGSSDIAQYIYSRGTANGKRVQAFGGAKNHGIVMPDADLDQVVSDLTGAAFGSAGERCMALPVVVPVGEKTADALREKLIPAIEALRVGVSTDPDAHYGPVVNAAHKNRVEDWIQTCADEGGELVVDGRGFSLQGSEKGFFVGPTLFDHVKPHFRSYQEEIFGPVLQIVRAADFNEAVRLPSEHQYGNGVAIFTRNGHAAREFAARVNVGMVGINVPIPVPVAYHTFGGWKRSGFGDTNQHGMEGVKFWTKVKTVTAALAGRRRAGRGECLRHPDHGVMCLP
jgi:malonate-semialdehyde dehydrogenase (acetylating)/methylmalonate-semialdehyde dehydrogenase